MTELKTLKDLEKEPELSSLGVESDFSDKVIITWLKQEAIKVLKSMPYEVAEEPIKRTVAFTKFMKFHNITEEELSK